MYEECVTNTKKFILIRIEHMQHANDEKKNISIGHTFLCTYTTWMNGNLFGARDIRKIVRIVKDTRFQ